MLGQDQGAASSSRGKLTEPLSSFGIVRLHPRLKRRSLCDGPEHVESAEGAGATVSFFKPVRRAAAAMSACLRASTTTTPRSRCSRASPNRDDNPYLKKDDAFKFALDRHAHAKKPMPDEFDVKRGFVECWPEVDDGATWVVLLNDAGSKNTYTSIFIHADRTINEKITKLNEGPWPADFMTTHLHTPRMESARWRGLPLFSLGCEL